MIATTDKRLIPASGEARRRRRLSALCLMLALALPALAAAGCATQGTAKAAASASPRPAEAAAQPATRPFVRTDRAVKLRLLQRLAQPPRILIFGGSRATRRVRGSRGPRTGPAARASNVSSTIQRASGVGTAPGSQTGEPPPIAPCRT